MRQHLVVDEFVLLGYHQSAVKDQHATVSRRVKYVNLLDGTFARDDLLGRLHGKAHVLRVFVSIPEFGLHR